MVYPVRMKHKPAICVALGVLVVAAVILVRRGWDVDPPAPRHEAADRRLPSDTRPVPRPRATTGDDETDQVESMPAPPDTAPTSPGTGPALPAAMRDAIPNEYVLGFYDDGDLEEFLRIARLLGVEILGQLELGNAVRIRVTDDAQLLALLNRGPVATALGRNVRVLRPVDPTPGDPRAPESGYVGFGNLAALWLGVRPDRTTRGDGVLIAVLDSGIGTHPALAGANIEHLDMLNGDGAYGTHGMAVASLLVGQSDAITGIAPNAGLLNVRVMSDDGTGDAFTIAAGIIAAADRGAQIINLSLGTFGDSFILAEAVKYAQDKGALLVAATGNNAVNGIYYPARYDGVLAVGAVDAAGRHLYFSNRGAEVDISAPGIAVNAAAPDGNVVAFSGTSAATPLVSGAAALLLADTPGLTPRQAGDILLAYSNDAGAPGPTRSMAPASLPSDEPTRERRRASTTWR